MYSAAWHPQADGQLGRSKQTAEIALHYYIATLEDPRQWPKVLPRMAAALNNSTTYTSTNKTSTEVLYGFRTREALDLLTPFEANEELVPSVPEVVDDQPNQPAEHTLNQPVEYAFPIATRARARQHTPSPTPDSSRPTPRRHTPAPTNAGRASAFPMPDAPEHTPIRPRRAQHLIASMVDYRPSIIDAQDAIALAAMTMKRYYDDRHTPKYFDIGSFVHLRLHKGYQVPGITYRKTGQQAVGPFKVLERIGTLAYRLELPPNLRVHPVISIAHLEPATDPTEDPYQRRPPAVPFMVDGLNEWKIERLLQKRRIRCGHGWSTQYLVRWVNSGPEHDQWIPDHRLMHAPELVQEFEQAFEPEAGLRP